jgi:phenylalanine-4-hydroxylase
MHKPGSLSSALDIFEKNKVNLKKIDSQPDTEDEYFKIYCNIDGTSEDENVANSIKELSNILGEKNIKVIGSEKKDIPWFPRKPQDLDILARKTMECGSELQSNHPGFKDEKYRERRKEIALLAQKYKHGQVLPHIPYTEEENKVWSIVYSKLKELYPTHACKEHQRVLPLLEKFAGYGPEKIPQLQEVR